MTDDAAHDGRLRIIPLGGCGEIGLNMTALIWDQSILVIDAGVMFPQEDMLGVDLVIPDARYLAERRDRIVGVVITHGHEDHIGALPFLLPEFDFPPVYGSDFSLALIQSRLNEHRLEADLNQVVAGDVVKLGPFEVEFIPVAHSIPHGFGLAITTPAGPVIHSGDFKIDHTLSDSEGTDLTGFAAWGRRGVLAMLADSTNVHREGNTLSEAKVKRTLTDIFHRVEGRIIIASFASNIRRVQQVIDAAAEHDRQVAYTGRSLVQNIRIAKELGLLEVPDGLEIEVKDITDLPARHVCLISTGSQGEPNAALTRISLGRHKEVQVGEGDVVVLSSRFIPGHEIAITQVINNLHRRGAEVLYEAVSDIHSSGHAYQEELRLLAKLVRPRYYMPVHGELRHLVRHAKLAMEMGLPRENVISAVNGDVIALDQDGVEVIDRIDTGRIFVDGKGIGDVGEVVLRDRRHLSEDGVVFVMVVVDSLDGQILFGPEVVSRGFVFEEENVELLGQAKEMVAQIVQDLAEPDWAVAQDEIRRALKRYFNKILQRRPVILPMVLPM